MKKFITLMLTLPLAVAAWGAQTPLCKLTFTSKEQFDQWKMVDANNDGQGSKYVFAFKSTEKAAYYTQTTKATLTADDWIISPAITLTGGKQYIITVSVKNYSTSYNDVNDFNVSYGTAQTVEGQTTPLLNVTGLKKSTAYVDKSSQTFTVENSGDYYFGIHLVSKGKSGDFGVKSFTIAEYVELPEKITGASVAPAALGEMKAELAWTNPSNNSDGGTLTALSGVRIYRQYRYQTDVVSNANLIATIAEGVTPGSSGTYTDTNFTEGSGTYYYAIVPYNENGASLGDPELASAWIGEEKELKRVNNLKAALDSDNDQHVLLSWDTPPQGAYGAYVNPEKISYRILRDDVVLQESWTGELPYKDTTVPGVGKYKYVVYALYNGQASTYSSTTITVKGVATLPYSNTFDKSNSVDDFTFVHASPGKYDWAFSYDAIKVYEKGTPNAFAFLPAFMLKAGKTYGVTFETKISGESSKNLSVVYGATATADGKHTEVFCEAITSTDYVEKTAAFTVPADGKYYIGFRFYGETTDWKDLYVDNVKVEELVEAPQPVGELTATVGAEGALEVALSWINPSLTNTGSNLTEITKVVVAREGVEVKVVDKPAPGAAGSFTDNTVPAPGIYHYTVTPYLNDNAAKAAEVVTAWVGRDTPKAPASVTVTSNADGRTVTFEAVSEGANGGYMPELTYTVSRNGVVLAENLTETSYLDSESNLPLGLYTYSVCAGYGDVTGQSASSDAVQLGEMLQLPYTPDFTNAQEFTLWNLDNGEGTQDWKLDKDTYFGLAIFNANNSWAYTPPFEAIMGTIKVTFVAAAQYDTPETLTVSLVRDAKEETPEEPSLAPTKAKAGDAWNHETVGASTTYTIKEWWSDSEFTTRTLDFDIPETGKYYVGFGVNVAKTGSLRFVLKKSDVKQSYISGLESIASDGAGFAYSATSQALLSTLPGRIEVFSLEGSLLLQGEGTTLATDGLVAGIYLARFTGNDGSSAVVKFVR